MAEHISETSPELILLDELEDFQKHALKAVSEGRRKVYILSTILDDSVYNTDEFRDALRDLVIQDRYCEARILVKDIKPVVEHGHRLLELARKLSSKVQMRKLNFVPRNSDQAYLIVDDTTLLYKHADDTYKGYVDYAARPKCKLLIEDFMNMWELYGEVDPSLRQQLI